MNEPNPYVAPAAAPPDKAVAERRAADDGPGPVFRWRVIVVTFTGFFGIFFVVMSLFGLGLLIYGFSQYGLHPVDPEIVEINPEILEKHPFVITPKKLAKIAGFFSAGVVLLLVCRGSWRKMRAQRTAPTPSSAEAETFQ